MKRIQGLIQIAVGVLIMMSTLVGQNTYLKLNDATTSEEWKQTLNKFKNAEKTVLQKDTLEIGKQINTLFELFNAIDSKTEKNKLQAEIFELNNRLKLRLKEYDIDTSNLSQLIVYYSGSNGRLIPVKNGIQAKAYFEGNPYSEPGIETLQNSLFSYGTDNENISAHTEILSDYLWVGRLSLGALIAQPSVDDSNNSEQITQENAVQRLLGGGGNFTLDYSVPLFDYQSKFNRFKSIVLFEPKLGADIPALSANINSFTYHLGLTVGGSLFISGLQNQFSFHLNGKASILNGNDAFLDNLLVQESDMNSFIAYSVNFGVTIANKYQIIINLNYNDVDNNELPFTNAVTFSIMP